MQITQVVDIEDKMRRDLTALYESLGIEDVQFSASPIPPQLGHIPASATQVCILRTGGTRQSVVVDTHAISLDVYSSDWDRTTAAANRLAGVIAQLPSQPEVSGWESVTISSLPYPLPDTSNPILPRVRLSISAVVKADIIEMSRK